MEFFPKVVFHWRIYNLSVPVTETVVVTWFIMAILIAVSYYAGKSIGKKSSTFQKLAEVFYEIVDKLVGETMGSERKGFVPYIGTLAAFLLLSNLAGLFTLRPPTADLSTTLTLAAITFVLTQQESIRRKGLAGYLKSFFEPQPLMAPLNIIGTLANPVSMAFRLFGNILGGMIIIGLIYSAVPLLVPVPLHFYFDVFAGVLQAFIFVMLTMVFVAMSD
ncbi:F0F1 ATP synthase subunit A [Thermosediminibacter oceani]|uniref:ATP synthase subunit a n=1 Tax=Thermosediminibacter oceani (strain ATCC BAA-1034 / DSM 16646 / JW/IW-1228P) TaxID=555079 RepID=D9RZW9_THEOJ|nr:F0F1 ATP synthase subunit A [Thermosediminibacter oceani]ADL08746.1 ATP synthase F0, A subunit [Thermosediminibacter oceani DSM 16646]